MANRHIQCAQLERCPLCSQDIRGQSQELFVIVHISMNELNVNWITNTPKHFKVSASTDPLRTWSQSKQKWTWGDVIHLLFIFEAAELWISDLCTSWGCWIVFDHVGMRPVSSIIKEMWLLWEVQFPASSSELLMYGCCHITVNVTAMAHFSLQFSSFTMPRTKTIASNIKFSNYHCFGGI